MTPQEKILFLFYLFMGDYFVLNELGLIGYFQEIKDHNSLGLENDIERSKLLEVIEIYVSFMMHFFNPHLFNDKKLVDWGFRV
jgi:hypothetical protein